MLKPILPVSVVALLALGGCRSDSMPPTTQPSGGELSENGLISRETYRGWDAYRLSNGTVDAVVVPDIGRIMYYGKTGSGEAGNVLWTNPQLAGQIFDGGDDWQNFGGDKVWPWPQNPKDGFESWVEHFGAPWPPPAPFRGVPWQVEVAGSSLVLTQDVAEPYGVEPVRTITIDERGTGLTITTMFTPVRDDGAEAGAWHITQISRPASTIVALGDNGGDLDPLWMGDDDKTQMLGTMAVGIRDVDGRPATAVVPQSAGAKVGFDAPILAAGMTLQDQAMVFVQEVLETSGDRMTSPRELAQVYISSPDAGELTPWSELEFAAPVGGTSTLSVKWQLIDLDGSATDPQAVATTAAAAVQ